MKLERRSYRCKNCGHEQLITTNHEGSWKPSFGKYAVPFNGRTYRPFEFVRQ